MLSKTTHVIAADWLNSSYWRIEVDDDGASFRHGGLVSFNFIHYPPSPFVTIWSLCARAGDMQQ